MQVQFTAIGLSFTADIEYRPAEDVVIGRTPEQSHAGAESEIEFSSLECAESDAMFLLRSDYAAEIEHACERAAIIQMQDDAFYAALEG